MSHQDLQDFRAIIGLWPSVQNLADDLDEKPCTVEKWRTRNRIPPRVWRRMLRKAQARALPITAEHFIRIAASK